MIELLVVIAIIGILASMLLPTLAKAKTKANRLKCTGNLKSVAQAFQSYSSAYEGTVPQLDAENTNASSAAPKNDYSKRLSFKEKFELEQLEKDLESLEKQKTLLTTALYETQEHEELQRLGDELKSVSEQLETAENRWLELSEREA